MHAIQARVHTPAQLAYWPRQPWCAALRTMLQQAVLFPVLSRLCRAEVSGAEHVSDLTGPAIIVANHASHLDTPLVLAALPSALRERTVVAAAADYFFTQPVLAALARLLVNAVPFQRHGHAGSSLRLCRRLTTDGWSLLLYPEGTRSTTGAMAAFQPGVGWLAVHLGCPVVPVYLEGPAAVLPKGRRWPHHGHVTVTIGQPLRLAGHLRPEAATTMIEAAVRALGAGGTGHAD